MRPLWSITADGEDVTARLADYLLSLSVTDAAGMESDEIQLDVADPQGRIAWPKTGAKLAASMGYAATGLVAMGEYLVDSVEVSSPPRKISIRGHAADLRRGLKNRKAKGWDNTTVGAIVADLAKATGLTATVDTSLAGLAVERWDQTNESDMACATRLATHHDAIATVKQGHLLFTRRGSGTTASGQAIPSIALIPESVSAWRVSVAEQDQYTAVEARSYDRGQAQETWSRSGDSEAEGEAVYRLRQTFPDQGRAKAAAQAKLGELERGKTALSLTLPGRTDILAETPLDLTAFGDGIDGRWIVVSATHRIDSGGYVTEIEGERPAE